MSINKVITIPTNPNIETITLLDGSEVTLRRLTKTGDQALVNSLYRRLLKAFEQHAKVSEDRWFEIVGGDFSSVYPYARFAAHMVTYTGKGKLFNWENPDSYHIGSFRTWCDMETEETDAINAAIERLSKKDVPPHFQGNPEEMTSDPEEKKG